MTLANLLTSRQTPVGKFAAVIRLAFPDDGELVAAVGFNMPVEALLAMLILPPENHL